ncbi:MAG: sigma-54-dependent transcriptional regulator [Opitutales bacterium]
MPRRILILDDDADFNHLLTDIFSQADYEVTSEMDPRKALEIFRNETYDLIVTDQQMPGMSGEDFIRQVKEVAPRTPVVMVSGFLDNDTIRGLIRDGVGGVFLKPLNVFSLLKRTAAILEQAAAAEAPKVEEPETEGEVAQFQHNLGFAFQTFPCRSKASAEFARRFHGLKDFKSNLVIIGEVGTPFSLLAQDLVNFSETAKEEFFFVERDAFDAETLKASILEAEERGDKRVTLVLLDAEILSGEAREVISAMAKKDGAFAELKAAPRLIFCLNEEVDALYDRGVIDDQLYLLIGTAEIRVPALREMKEDIPLLAQRYLSEAVVQRGLEGTCQIQDDAADFIRTQPWPGNCGELRAAVLSALAASDGQLLLAEHFEQATAETPLPVPVLDEVTNLRDHLDAWRREYASAVLLLKGGDWEKAKDSLGIGDTLMQALVERV